MDQNQTQALREDEALRVQKKLLLHARLGTLILLAALVLLCAALRMAYGFVPRVQTMLDHMETSLAEIDVLVENANGMVERNTDAVTEAVEKVRSIDVERFNEAVGNLADAARPLANLNNFFSR